MFGKSMLPLSKQCHCKAEEDGYTSLMSETKWRELCMAFAGFESKPAWRTRDFLNGHLSDWDSEWFYHVGPDYCSIEWLEIDPKECERGQIRHVLATVSAPFEESYYFKVFGYRK